MMESDGVTEQALMLSWSKCAYPWRRVNDRWSVQIASPATKMMCPRTFDVRRSVGSQLNGGRGRAAAPCVGWAGIRSRIRSSLGFLTARSAPISMRFACCGRTATGCQFVLHGLEAVGMDCGNAPDRRTASAFAASSVSSEGHG